MRIPPLSAPRFLLFLPVDWTVAVGFTGHNDNPGFVSQLVGFFHQRKQQFSQEEVTQMIGAKLDKEEDQILTSFISSYILNVFWRAIPLKWHTL